MALLLANRTQGMTSKQVRDARDAKREEAYAPKLIETTVDASYMRTWELRKGTYVAGKIEQYNGKDMGCVQPFKAYGRAYGPSSMTYLGGFCSLWIAQMSIIKLK